MNGNLLFNYFYINTIQSIYLYNKDFHWNQLKAVDQKHVSLHLFAYKILEMCYLLYYIRDETKSRIFILFNRLSLFFIVSKWASLRRFQLFNKNHIMIYKFNRISSKRKNLIVFFLNQNLIQLIVTDTICHIEKRFRCNKVIELE